MAIKKFYVNNPKDGYPFDRNAKKYFSWGYDIWLSGERKEERGFLTRDAAETAVKDLKQVHKNAKHGKLPEAETPYLIELLQKKLDTMTGPDRVRAKRVFTDFLELLPKRLKVTELKTFHIQLYNEKRLKDGMAASTIKRELVPLTAALHSADLFYGELESYRPPKIPRPKISKLRKTRTITSEERKAIFDHLFAPPLPNERWPKQYETRRRVGLFLQFALLTVSRPGEVAALKRTDIDLDAGIVRITGTKSRFVSSQPVRFIKITATMRSILLERMKKSEGDFLFVRGGKVTQKMYQHLRKACEACGIKYGKREMEGITFHTARHTATSQLINSGVDLRSAGRFTGHSDETMTMYYAHGESAGMEKASEVLERNMGNFVQDGEFPETKQKSGQAGRS